MLAVAEVPLKSLARASTRASEAAFAAAYAAFLLVGACASLAEMIAKRPCCGRLERIGERPRDMDGRTHEQVVQPVPVFEGLLGERCTATPPANQVPHGVHRGARP